MAIIAPIFTIIKTSDQVKALFGSDPIRVYPFNLVDSTVAKPYAVWQNVDGSPENYLNQRPDADRHDVQVTVYADTAEDAQAGAEALNYALETQAYITRWGDQDRDSNTKEYSFTFDVSIYSTRGSKPW